MGMWCMVVAGILSHSAHNRWKNVGEAQLLAEIEREEEKDKEGDGRAVEGGHWL